jgi:hypothetical protein
MLEVVYMQLIVSMLLVFTLFGCATLTATNNYDLGRNHLADGNNEAAYRFFEDPSPGHETDVDMILKTNPQLIQAGFYTFSVDALKKSIQQYGREKSFFIERHRLERFRIYSSNDQYTVAEANFTNEFQQEIVINSAEDIDKARVASLPLDEQSRYYEEKAKAERAANTSTGIVLNVQISNESHINTGAGAKLGAAYGQAAYIDNTNIWKYRATSQINSGLTGAIIGGLLDKPTQIPYRTIYYIKLENGDVKRFDFVSSDQTHIPTGVCVEFSEPFHIEIVNQKKCSPIQNQ